MKAGLYLSTVLRESRGSRGRLMFLVLCLAMGVAAVTGVSVLVAALDGALAANAKRLLAADIAIESRQPLPAELEQAVAAEPALDVTRMTELPTMAAAAGRDAPGASRLVELRALDGVFPFHGGLKLAPDRPLHELLDGGSAAVAPELLGALGLSVGDDLLLGGQPFRIVAEVLEEPDRLEFSLSLGPRVFVTAEGLARTSLLGLGSRVEHKLLLRAGALDSRGLESLADRLRDGLPDGGPRVRVRTWKEAGANLQRGLRRVERYAALAALLSLVLGATGAAQVVRAWIQSRTRAVAILRCLGMRPREILIVSLGQVLLLAAVGCVLGGLVGSLLPRFVIGLAGGLLPGTELPYWQPAAILRGCLVGLSVALVFSLPPLLAIWRVSPARVLRAEVEPLPPPKVLRVFAGLVLAGGLFAVAWFQSRDLEAAGGFTGGLIVTALVLAAVSRAVMGLVARLPRDKVPATLRLGLGALARPGAGTTAGIVALGLGVLVVMHMALVETRLDTEIDQLLPRDAPSAFLVDVQPGQWSGVQTVLEQHRAENVRSVPVVTARLAAIDGRRVDEIVEDRHTRGHRRGEWRLTREQRLTWLDELPEDNTLVAGTLWSDPAADELSIEREFAEDIDVALGSQLVFDVQGVEVPLTVTSIREVEWRSFGINFFLVVEPGVLDDAPHMRIASARIAPPDEPPARDAVVAQAPNVALIGIREIIERVAGLVGRMSTGVRLLGGFTVLTGLLVLGGAVASSSLRRRREAALLKTLGVTRRGVVTLFGLEYALSGAVAGLVGGVFAFVLSEVFLQQVLEIEPRLPWLAGLAGCVVGSAALSAACGLLTSLRALSAPARAALAEEQA